MNLLKPFTSTQTNKKRGRKQPRDSLRLIREKQTQEQYLQRDELDEVFAHAVMVAAFDKKEKNDATKLPLSKKDKRLRDLDDLKEIENFVKALQATSQGQELLQKHMENRQAREVVCRAA